MHACWCGSLIVCTFLATVHLWCLLILMSILMNWGLFLFAGIVTHLHLANPTFHSLTLQTSGTQPARRDSTVCIPHTTTRPMPASWYAHRYIHSSYYHQGFTCTYVSPWKRQPCMYILSEVMYPLHRAHFNHLQLSCSDWEIGLATFCKEGQSVGWPCSHGSVVSSHVWYPSSLSFF